MWGKSQLLIFIIFLSITVYDNLESNHQKPFVGNLLSKIADPQSCLELHRLLGICISTCDAVFEGGRNHLFEELSVQKFTLGLTERIDILEDELLADIEHIRGDNIHQHESTENDSDVLFDNKESINATLPYANSTSNSDQMQIALSELYSIKSKGQPSKAYFAKKLEIMKQFPDSISQLDTRIKPKSVKGSQPKVISIWWFDNLII